MGRTGYMNRYECRNCEQFFRGLNEETCPLCGSKNIHVIARGVGD